MRKHKVPFKALSMYIDDRCFPADKNKVESHVTECDQCRHALLSIKNSNSAINNLHDIEASSNFNYKFNNKLNEIIRLREEKEFIYIISTVIGRIKTAIIPPAPVLAKITASILFIFFAYGALNYLLVGSPSITMAKGNVDVYSAKEKSWITVTKGLKLAKNDIIDVKKDSFIDIGQFGKYTMRIKGKSEVILTKLLPKYINGTIVYSVKRGKVFTSINEDFKGSKFLIKTPEAEASALGTKFLINVSIEPKALTRFSVLDGKIKVKSLVSPEERAELQQVIVDSGEITEVYKGSVPSNPRQLRDTEWQELVEFYNIDKKPQVALLISTGKHRTRELLRPCPIFIFDVEPRTVSESIEETVRIIDDAIKADDRAKHIEGIKRLEQILVKYPSPNYEPQLFLFIGSYYNYLNMPEESIEMFQKVADKYPQSTFASIALYACGIIYDKKIKDKTKAQYYYNLILKRYRESPEAEDIKDVRKKIVRR